jgi:hypothetical protein
MAKLELGSGSASILAGGFSVIPEKTRAGRDAGATGHRPIHRLADWYFSAFLCELSASALSSLSLFPLLRELCALCVKIPTIPTAI